MVRENTQDNTAPHCPGTERPRTELLFQQDRAAHLCLFFHSIGGKQTADTIWSILGKDLSNRSTAGASFTLWKVQMGLHEQEHRCKCAKTHTHAHTHTHDVCDTAGRLWEQGIWILHLTAVREPKNILPLLFLPVNWASGSNQRKTVRRFSSPSAILLRPLLCSLLNRPITRKMDSLQFHLHANQMQLGPLQPAVSRTVLTLHLTR